MFKSSFRLRTRNPRGKQIINCLYSFRRVTVTKVIQPHVKLRNQGPQWAPQIVQLDWQSALPSHVMMYRPAMHFGVRRVKKRPEALLYSAVTLFCHRSGFEAVYADARRKRLS